MAERALILAQITGHLAQAHFLAGVLGLGSSDWEVLMKPYGVPIRPDIAVDRVLDAPKELPLATSKPGKEPKEPGKEAKTKRPMSEKQTANEEAYKAWFISKLALWEERKASWAGPVEFAEDKPHYIHMKKLYKAEKEAGMTDEERAASAQKTTKSKKSKKTEKVASKPKDDETEFWTMTLNGKEYIYDELNNCWELDTDGSKGNWAGIYDTVTKMIDDTAEEPTL